jgi:hypothetical protein
MADLQAIVARAAYDLASQVLMLLGALALLAAVLHVVERRLSTRLAHRFGWRSVLVTGWLGVPIHECSHLVMCLLFRHRIVAVKLFDPDPATGTLGYVQHAYRRRNLYQIAGNFFIGIAPLLGGSAFLLAALAILLPDARPAFSTAPLPEHFADQLGVIAGHAFRTTSALLAPEHRASWQLWAFLGITLCVGTHLSPSRPDLSGALPGLGIVLAGLLLWNLIAAAGWVGRGNWAAVAGGALAPLLGVLLLAVGLQLVFWLVVEVVVWLTMPRRRSYRR